MLDIGEMIFQESWSPVSRRRTPWRGTQEKALGATEKKDKKQPTEGKARKSRVGWEYQQTPLGRNDPQPFSEL
jgi:hypothetical protein